MKILFLEKFNKDLDKIKEVSIKKKIVRVIREIESAHTLRTISNIKKIKGDTISYRIRIGDYRLGIYFENGTVELARFVHRKDIYKKFPG